MKTTTQSIVLCLILLLGINSKNLFSQGNGNSNCFPTVSASFSTNGLSVTAFSSKDLSNVVLHYCDGARQKINGLSGYEGTYSGSGENTGKIIQGVWIKSGCNNSGDGPGYGQYVANPDENVCNPIPPGCFTHEIISYNPGLRFDNSEIPESRRNPEKALGEPERSDASTSEANVNFVALGFGGELTVKFIAPIKNGPGADIKVWETTFPNFTNNCVTYPETIIMFASQDGCNWKYLGDGCQDAEFDLSAGGLEWAQYFRMIDVSPKAAFGSVGHIADGYDVDGLECLNGFEANPVFQEFNCEFATFVVDYQPGSGKILPAPLAERQDPNKALGEPERADNMNFVSLGFGGVLILGFSCVIFDKPGYDIEIVETSFGSQTCTSYPERARVDGSLDLVNWFTIGEVCLDGFLDLDGKGPIQYIRITDISNSESFSNSNISDGFDVDGVVVTQPGCFSTPARFAAPESLSSIATGDVNIYPNPFSDIVTLDFVNGVTDSRINLAVFNYMGQQIINEQLNVATETAFRQVLDLGSYPKGIYIVQVNNAGTVKTFKILRQ
jgi:hypothetical protein